jgi:septal ring-binding cell division protein DamX
MKPLSKALLAKLSPSETKKLKSLQDKCQKLQNEMIKAQTAYSIASRKDSSNKNLHKMADKGFKYQMLAFNANEELNKYVESLKKK